MKALLLSLIYLCCYSVAAYGQGGQGFPTVEFVTQYTSNGVALVNHNTLPVSVSGINPALLACITAEEGPTADETVTSITRAGQSFTKVATSPSGVDQVGAGFYATVAYLPSPSLGSAAVTYSHVNASQSAAFIVLLGGAQQNALGLSATARCAPCTPPGRTSAELITQVANTLLMTCTHSNQSQHNHVPDAGQFLVQQLTIPQGSQWTMSISTRLAGLPATSVTLGITATNAIFATDRMEFVAVGIGPPGVAVGGRRRIGSWP